MCCQKQVYTKKTFIFCRPRTPFTTSVGTGAEHPPRPPYPHPATSGQPSRVVAATSVASSASCPDAMATPAEAKDVGEMQDIGTALPAVDTPAVANKTGSAQGGGAAWTRAAMGVVAAAVVVVASNQLASASGRGEAARDLD